MKKHTPGQKLAGGMNRSAIYMYHSHSSTRPALSASARSMHRPSRSRTCKQHAARREAFLVMTMAPTLGPFHPSSHCGLSTVGPHCECLHEVEFGMTRNAPLPPLLVGRPPLESSERESGCCRWPQTRFSFVLLLLPSDLFALARVQGPAPRYRYCNIKRLNESCSSTQDTTSAP